MIISGGTNAASIRNGQVLNVDCPNCKTNTTMNYSVFGKYMRFIVIPFFPMKRIIITECCSCKKTYEYINFVPKDIKLQFEKEKIKTPIPYPIWMYTGLFLTLLLIGYFFYDLKKTSANNSIYIKNPKIGDVYYIKNSEGHYTTARVDKVTRTEVYVTNNDYEIDLDYQVSTIDEEKNYTVSKDTLNYFDIQEAFKTEKIFKVIRN